ncbi:MAG TPA: stage III sporulation protein AF [Symbiobacteriaceae bacterium]|nr:stage III sporulation protein AF [Symbiobacteriaceae bacterium]
MEWLKEWVRHLVTLVILAATLEMALPMGNMKRYVKLTMGLLILFAMISPWATLLRNPMPIEWHLFEPAGGALPSLSQVMTAARDFGSKQEALARAGAEEEMANSLRQALLALPGLRDAQVAVKLGAKGEVEAVDVVANPGSPGSVRPVAPVTVGGKPEPQAKALDPALLGSITAVLRAQVGPKVPISISGTP